MRETKIDTAWRRIICVSLVLPLLIVLSMVPTVARADAPFLIGDWETDDGSAMLTFWDDGTFTLDLGFFPEEGVWSAEDTGTDVFPIQMDGSSILTLMSYIYGVTSDNYHFEILKRNDDNFYLVQVYDDYTAETSPCKLPFTRVGSAADFSEPTPSTPPANDGMGVIETVTPSIPAEDTKKLTIESDEVLWGPGLFETPSTELCNEPLSDKNLSNYNLAMVAGCLCRTSHDSGSLVNVYKTLGFNESDVYLYSYPDATAGINRKSALRDGLEFASDNDLAFSIASKAMTVDGEPGDLLVITLLGTHRVWEMFLDRMTLATKEYYGHTAYDVSFEFEEDVFAGLEDYYSQHQDLGTRKLRILVSGHSLGGSGANLIAAKLNNECNTDRWFARNTDRDDIYAYTFGAIDALKQVDGETMPISSGYENIINIYNYLDNFGPNGYQVLTAAGNSIYGKYGVFFTFTNDMNGVDVNAFWPTHDINGYVHAVKEGWPKYDDFSMSQGKRIIAACPVDIAVRQGGDVVCSFENDVITMSSPDISAVAAGDQKILILPKDGDYTVDLIATGDGEMFFGVQALDADDPQWIDYQNVTLTSGKRMESEIAPSIATDQVELFVVNDSGERVAQIKRDGSETPVDGSGIEVVESLSENGNLWWIVLIVAAVIIALVVIKTVSNANSKRKRSKRHR